MSALVHSPQSSLTTGEQASTSSPSKAVASPTQQNKAQHIASPTKSMTASPSASHNAAAQQSSTANSSAKASPKSETAMQVDSESATNGTASSAAAAMSPAKAALLLLPQPKKRSQLEDAVQRSPVMASGSKPLATKKTESSNQDAEADSKAAAASPASPSASIAAAVPSSPVASKQSKQTSAAVEDSPAKMIESINIDTADESELQRVLSAGGAKTPTQVSELALQQATAIQLQQLEDSSASASAADSNSEPLSPLREDELEIGGKKYKIDRIVDQYNDTQTGVGFYRVTFKKIATSTWEDSRLLRHCKSLIAAFEADRKVAAEQLTKMQQPARLHKAAQDRLQQLKSGKHANGKSATGKKTRGKKKKQSDMTDEEVRDAVAAEALDDADQQQQNTDATDDELTDKGENEFEVEAILGERRKKGSTRALEFHVRWKGYPLSDATWEPLANVKGCDAYVEWKRTGGKPQSTAAPAARGNKKTTGKGKSSKSAKLDEAPRIEVPPESDEEIDLTEVASLAQSSHSPPVSASAFAKALSPNTSEQATPHVAPNDAAIDEDHQSMDVDDEAEQPQQADDQENKKPSTAAQSSSSSKVASASPRKSQTILEAIQHTTSSAENGKSNQAKSSSVKSSASKRRQSSSSIESINIDSGAPAASDYEIAKQLAEQESEQHHAATSKQSNKSKSSTNAGNKRKNASASPAAKRTSSPAAKKARRASTASNAESVNSHSDKKSSKAKAEKTTSKQAAKQQAMTDDDDDATQEESPEKPQKSDKQESESDSESSVEQVLEFEVDEVVAETVRNGKTLYLVHWKSYDDSENTWEPLANLVGAEECIKAFKEKQSKEKAQGSASEATSKSSKAPKQ